VFKRVVWFEPKEGLDLEATWKYWIEDFGPRHISPDHIRFSVSRVIKKYIGNGKLWGISESWYDSDESFRSSHAKHQEDPEFMKRIEEWHNYWTVRAHLLFEEKRLFERPDWKSSKGGVKRASFFIPKEKIDLEAAWKYWIEDFGPRHAGPDPGLMMTCINRITGKSEMVGLWGMAEAWFESIEAMRNFGAKHHNDPKMKLLIDKWNSQWAEHTSYVMEEKVLFQR
jgi:hypothetical protein